MNTPSPYTRTERALIDNVRWLLWCSPGDMATIAVRVGATEESLPRRLRKAGRADLVHRMLAYRVVAPRVWSCGSPSCSECHRQPRRRVAA